MESMMCARQVAELLGVHENWVYDQAVSGELPSYKIGGTRRLDPDELRGWIADHREPEHDRKLPRKAVRVETARRRRTSQLAEQQSELEQKAPVSRKRDRTASRLDVERQPRLFET